jgi:phosphatidate cytidylyltransferase
MVNKSRVSNSVIFAPNTFLMALNVKTFLTRSMSAVVFVLVLLGSLFFSYATFSLFFLLVALIGVKEFIQIAEKLGAQPHKPAVYITSLVLYLCWLNWWQLSDEQFGITSLYLRPYGFLAIIPFLFLSIALFSKSQHPIPDAIYSVAGIVYAVVPMCLLHELVFISSEDQTIYAVFDPWILFGIILLIWCNDTFAYLGGSLFGKRKLIERISPGKTIEGTAFGIAMTVALSALMSHLLPVVPPIHWMLLGLVVPILATLGDLIESMLKRSAGIKDSGAILPGHGGVLDRFDSLILVSPVVALLFKLSQF